MQHLMRLADKAIWLFYNGDISEERYNNMKRVILKKVLAIH